MFAGILTSRRRRAKALDALHVLPLPEDEPYVLHTGGVHRRAPESRARSQTAAVDVGSKKVRRAGDWSVGASTASRTASRFGFCQPFSDPFRPVRVAVLVNKDGVS